MQVRQQGRHQLGYLLATMTSELAAYGAST